MIAFEHARANERFNPVCKQLASWSTRHPCAELIAPRARPKRMGLVKNPHRIADIIQQIPPAIRVDIARVARLHVTDRIARCHARLELTFDLGRGLRHLRRELQCRARLPACGSQARQQNPPRIVLLQFSQHLDDILPKPPVLHRLRIQHHAPAEGLHRGIPPDHKPVASGGNAGFFQAQLHELGIPRWQNLAFEQHHAGQHSSRPHKQLHAHAIRHLCGRIGQEVQAGVDHIRGLKIARLDEQVPACYLIHDNPAQIDGCPRAHLRHRHRSPMGLHPAHAHGFARGQQGEFVAHLHRPRNHRARDHCAKALHGKCAVYGQAKHALVRPRFNRCDLGLDQRAQGGDPLAAR